MEQCNFEENLEQLVDQRADYKRRIQEEIAIRVHKLDSWKSIEQYYENVFWEDFNTWDTKQLLRLFSYTYMKDNGFHLAEYLKNIGQPSNLSARKKVFQCMSNEAYTWSPTQNKDLYYFLVQQVEIKKIIGILWVQEQSIDARNKLKTEYVEQKNISKWNNREKWWKRSISVAKNVDEKKEVQGKNGEKNSTKMEAMSYKSFIFDKNDKEPWNRQAYQAEMKIKQAYGEQVHQLFQKYGKWSVVDEWFLYWIIAKESRFETNARSQRWVTWLCQITQNTLRAIIRLNKQSVSDNPESMDLYVTSWLLDKKWNINKKASLEPLNQMKLAMSYLFYLEDKFSYIKNPDFRKEVMLTAYNVGEWKVESILKKYPWIDDWAWLKVALQADVKKWGLSRWKFKEVTNYVLSVLHNIHLTKS